MFIFKFYLLMLFKKCSAFYFSLKKKKSFFLWTISSMCELDRIVKRTVRYPSFNLNSYSYMINLVSSIPHPLFPCPLDYFCDIIPRACHFPLKDVEWCFFKSCFIYTSKKGFFGLILENFKYIYKYKK